MTDYTGQQWGSYRLVRLLGSGGFADVYLGEHIHLATQAALKILTTKLASEEISRFRDEARTIMQLEHPHIVRVLDFGLENRIPFIVMSYAPGGSLRQQHPQGTALALPLVINYVKQIASALHHAHEQKLIHRDVKPDNMLIARNKELLLSDFGIVAIAHSTRTLSTQDASGTIYYMAPEQSLGKPRPASDQYALGIAVYEWLTGTFPFTGTAMEIAMQHLVAPPPPLREKIPTISPEIEQVVLRTLAKKPEERFPDVMAFATALEQAEKPDKTEIAPSPVQRAVSPITFTVLSGSGDLKWISGEPYYGVGYGDGLIQVWQCATNQLVSTCYGHTDRVRDVTWSPDGTRLASTSNDGTVRIWKAMTGQSLAVASRPGAQRYWEAAWSPDGTRLVVSSDVVEYKHFIDILDANTGSSITSFESQYLDQSRWFPDGTRITTFINMDQTLQIIEATTGRLLASYKLPKSNEMIYSPDCTYLAIAMVVKETMLLEIREVATGHVIASYSDTGHCIQWSPDSRYLAFALKEAIQVREALTGRLVASYTGHKDQVHSIAWHPFDTRVAASSDEKTIQVWEAMKGHHLITHSRKSSKSADLEWAPDGTRLLSSSCTATIQVVNRATGQAASTIYCGHDDRLYTVVWSPDGTKIATGSHKGVTTFHAQTGYHIATYTPDEREFHARIAWSPGSEQIASCFWNFRGVKVLHAETGRHLATYVSNDHNQVASTVAWSPNGRYIAIFYFDLAASSSGYKGTVEVWEVATKQLVTTYTMSDRSRDSLLATSVSWSPDSARIASGYGNFIVWSPDGKYIVSNNKIEMHDAMTGRFLSEYGSIDHYSTSVQVWNTRTGSSRIICQGTASVESAVWSPDENYIAAGHSDYIVRVWDIATDRVVAVHRGYMSNDPAWGGVTWSPDGNHLAYNAFSDEIQTYPGVS